MSDRFVDDRGVIQDLFAGKPVVVTRITTVKGAVRGNHVHRKTMQWTYVFKGQLQMVSGDQESLIGPGQLVAHPPGVPHAWKAVVDTTCFVFTRGPRSGKDYESDTHRLEQPLI